MECAGEWGWQDSKTNHGETAKCVVPCLFTTTVGCAQKGKHAWLISLQEQNKIGSETWCVSRRDKAGGLLSLTQITSQTASSAERGTWQNTICRRPWNESMFSAASWGERSVHINRLCERKKERMNERRKLAWTCTCGQCKGGNARQGRSRRGKRQQSRAQHLPRLMYGHECHRQRLEVELEVQERPFASENKASAKTEASGTQKVCESV